MAITGVVQGDIKEACLMGGGGQVLSVWVLINPFLMG